MPKKMYEPKSVFGKILRPDLSGGTKPKPALGRVLPSEEPHLKPRLKGGAELVAQEYVYRGRVDAVEVWKSPKGFYIYYRLDDNSVDLASGPRKSESRILKEAKRIAEALRK